MKEAYGRVENVGKFCNNLWVKYRMTRTEFERLWVEQEGRCAVCKRVFGDPLRMGEVGEKPNVDHDHSAGEIQTDAVRYRGLLCVRCNTYLGKVEGPVLKGMVEYLKKYGNW